MIQYADHTTIAPSGGTTHCTVVRGDVADMPALLDISTCPPQNAKHLQEVFERLDAATPGRRGGFLYDGAIELGDVSCRADAVRLFEQGWAAGGERAMQECATPAMRDLAPTATERKPRRRVSDTGSDLRIDAVLARDWDRAYTTRQRIETPSARAVSIGCGFGGGSVIGHEEMFWNGAQMAVLCDLLEAAGWRVELRALKLNDMHDFLHLQDWTVKTASQPARLDLIAALFGHAGVYRTYGWAGNLHSLRKVPSSMGQVAAERLVGTVAQLAAANLVAPLSLVVPQAWDRDDAIENIRHALTSITSNALAA